MNVSSWLGWKNSENLAKWRWRWHLQGGSQHWTAKPLQDLRNDEDLRRYRGIEFKRRRSPYGRRVVSLTAFKFERERQRIYKRWGVVA